MKLLLKITLLLIVLVIILIILIWVCNTTINKKTAAHIYDNVQEIPYNKVGLLLGTSKYLKNGNPNEYFMNRIDATVDLYNSGKISYILASGDNNSVADNEPQDMKDELIARGIPDTVIYLDYAGLRTFDSVIRIYKIFGQSSFTVISQKFHNQRAIYIAQSEGLTAYGYNAKDVSSHSGLKTKVRERFARVKVFIDKLINKQPRFLGESIEIG